MIISKQRIWNHEINKKLFVASQKIDFIKIWENLTKVLIEAVKSL